jgi:2-iminobutanoate/2-iminopropanoate deaminase
MRREITAPGVAEPISHYCDAVEANGFLFVSGCPALDEHGDLVGGDDTVAQCEQVLKNLGAILQAAGCAPADVVKVNVYLTDVDDRPLINPLRQAFFGESRPASTLVGVRELPVPGMKVEIEAVAVLPDRFGRAQQAAH